MLILYTPLDIYRPLVSTVTQPRLVTSVNICCFYPLATHLQQQTVTERSHRLQARCDWTAANGRKSCAIS